MSMLFISHDLGVVGEIADHVVVMRDGVVREQGRSAQIFERAAGRVHEGAARLPAAARRSARGACPSSTTSCDGRIRRRHGERSARIARRRAGADRSAATCAKSFWMQAGLLRPRRIQGGARRDASSCARASTLGVVGESGSGKTTLGLDAACACTKRSGGEVLFDGRDLLALSTRADAGRTSGASRSCSRTRTRRSTRASRSARPWSSRC